MIRLFVLWLAVLVTAPSFAQFWSGSPLGSGTNNSVLALYAAQGDTVYAGGRFTMAGGQSAPHLAMFTHGQWSKLGQGFFENVKVITRIGGKLYVGGEFGYYKDSIVNGFAEWDGTNFNGFARGFFKSGQHTVAMTVNAIAEYNGSIYAGGIYDYANDQADYIKNIARWNGTKWEAVGGGLDGPSGVNCMIVYNGELYAGGGFTSAGAGAASRIAKWNGTAWSPVGGGMNGEVNTMVVLDDTLYAAGIFTTAGGQPASRIARLVGNTWQALGDGVNGSVYALSAGDFGLVAGGAFTSAGGQAISYAAQWDGSWKAAGAPGSTVWSMASRSGNEAIFGGDFSNVSGVAMSRIARMYVVWDGIGPASERGLRIFPNPSNAILHIDAEGMQNPGTVRITDLIGRVLYEAAFSGSIDVSALPSGKYVLTIEAQTGIRVTPLNIIHD